MKKIIGFYRKCDFLTMFSIVSSLIGIICAINNHFTVSMLFLLICGLCDAFDGRLARKYKYSEEAKVYGSELDSLADTISFGVFPAVITAFISSSYIAYIICIIYTLCGVIRLAYFNMLLITKTGKSNTYIGLPITSISVAYPIIFLITRLINFDLLHIVMPCVLVVFGLLFVLRFEFPKPDIGKIFKKILNKYVINYLIFPVFIIVLADIFYKLSVMPLQVTTIFTTITNGLLAFIATVIFFASILVLLNSIFNNAKISKIIMLIITTILLAGNEIKYIIMGNPIELSDIHYLNPDNMQMMATATTTIGSWIFKVILKAIIMLALGFGFIYFDKTKHIIKKNYKRIIFGIVSLFLILTPFIFKNKIAAFELKNIYRIKSIDTLQNYTNDRLYYEYGYFQGLYLNELAKESLSPEGYDLSIVSEAIKEATTSNQNKDAWKKSNVVIILSEAFSDIQNIDEVKFTERITPNIDQYAKDGDKLVLDLLVPTFGGVSVNSEFEVLTSGSISFMKSGFIPWTQYYTNQNGKLAPNLFKEFHNNGYSTMYLTPWGRDSYRSEYVYDLFGVDKKIYKDSFKGNSNRVYYSDISLMDNIYNELKDTSNDNYKFIVSASSENHYPYDIPYDKYDIKIKSSKYNKEDTDMIKTYAQGVYNADFALNYLYNKIQKLDTPTIILFYGDHLPYTVDSKGYNPYLGSSYFQTNDEELNNLRKYTTKGVILANYPLSVDKMDYVNASYLGAYLLNKMNLKTTEYYKFIDYTRSIIPVFNRSIIYKNNEIIKIGDLNGLEKEQLLKYRFVQYNRFYDI